MDISIRNTRLRIVQKNVPINPQGIEILMMRRAQRKACVIFPTIALSDIRAQPLRPILHLIKRSDLTPPQMTRADLIGRGSLKVKRIEMLQQRLNDPLTNAKINSRNPNAGTTRVKFAQINRHPPVHDGRVSVKQCG